MADPKGRAFAHLRRDLDPTLESFHAVYDDVQADAAACDLVDGLRGGESWGEQQRVGFLLGQRGFGSHQVALDRPFEDLRRVDSSPVVFHFDHGRPVAVHGA